MRRKKEGLLARTRETIGTGTPKRRKKEGVFDRINEKGLPVPTQKTSWEIYLFLLKMRQKNICDTPHHHIITPPSYQLLSPLTFIEHHTYNTHGSSCPHHTT